MIDGFRVEEYSKNVRFVQNMLYTMVSNGLIADYWVEPYTKEIINSLTCNMGLTSNRYILVQKTMKVLCDPMNIPHSKFNTSSPSDDPLFAANKILYCVCVMHLLGYGVKVMANELLTTEEEIYYAIDVIKNNNIIDWK